MANVIYADNEQDMGGSYISWSAVIAGALIATAYSFLMLTFGAAAGLSLASPFQDGEVETILLIAVALWLLWVQVSGFALGAYVAGRIRIRAINASEHEVDIRDGVHGQLVWATGILIGFLLAVALTGSIIGFSSQAVGSLFSAAAERKGPVSQAGADALADTLLRPTGNTPRAEADVRSEVGRTVAPALSGQNLNEADRSYLTQIVSAETGLTAPEAEARVDQVLAGAQQAAEDARKAAVIIGFVVVASLLISAAAAWWAATAGGDHRDKGEDFSHIAYWPAPAVAPVTRKSGDDLTEIKGIGPTLKAQLYNKGIRTFDQIANLSPAEVERISEELKFPGRIEREDWIGQAKALSKS